MRAGFVTSWLAIAACHGGAAHRPANATASPAVANLHAFARLYGVLRWFHPSDAAAEIDWDRFAIEGARRVTDAPNTRALRAALTDLIAPFAPTVHLAAAGEPFPDEPALHPPAAATLDVVAWEHKGYGDSAVVSAYASKRRHRDRTAAVSGFPYGALWQDVDATPYRGARVRFRGQLRTSAGARGRLWLRVDRGDATGFSDSMDERPVASKTWTSADIVGNVAADATRIVVGTTMSGGGTVWYDDLELAVQAADGTWTRIELKDPDFEAGDVLASWKPGLASPSTMKLDGWNATLDHDRPRSGAASLRVEAATHVVSDELFADAPRPGETVDIDLGAGLRARVPIALYSKDGHTLGDDPAAARRSQASPPAASPPGYDALAGAADVIVAWNVLEHFWPYWDLVPAADWTAELDTALRDALDDRTVENHLTTLQRLSAAAPDGHARMGCPALTRRAQPPFAVDVIEGQVVVIATTDPAIVRGDIVVSVEGRPAAAQLGDDEALASGSPQYRQVRARRRFGTGPAGSILRLRVRRAGIERDVTVVRDDRTANEPQRPAIERLEDGVYSIDMSRASMAEIDAVMDRLASAPGIVFDLRGYPNGTHNVLSHLLTRPDDSKDWLAVPRIIRPDHGPTSIAGWDKHGWEMPVLEPHIAGRVAFLTGPAAVSYAESVMGLVEHYHLGEIVGSPTAGTNGNIAQIAEPTGCFSVFTGMRVAKSDGSRFHLIGVLPTIPASRTIAGVIAGRDEVLEKALAYMRGLPR